MGSAVFPGSQQNEGLLLERCRSVHTFRMRFAIDAVVLDRHGRVVTVVGMAPRRLLRPRRKGRHVLEVAAGAGPKWASLYCSGCPERASVPIV